MFFLDADFLGLTEADYATLEIVGNEQWEHIDPLDEEDIVEWGQWG